MTEPKKGKPRGRKGGRKKKPPAEKELPFSLRLLPFIIAAIRADRAGAKAALAEWASKR